MTTGRRVLLNAELEAKLSRTASSQIRVATAYKALRQWKRCKTAASLGLSLEPDEFATKELQECFDTAELEIGLAATRQNWATFEEHILPTIMDRSDDIA